jgi:hypothetical protein
MILPVTAPKISLAAAAQSSLTAWLGLIQQLCKYRVLNAFKCAIFACGAFAIGLNNVLNTMTRSASLRSPSFVRAEYDPAIVARSYASWLPGLALAREA